MKKNKEELSKQLIPFPSSNFKIIVNDGTSKVFNKAYHEEIELKYFYEGVSTVMVDNNVIATKPGDIIVINPFEIHSNVNIGKLTGKYVSIIIDIDFLKELNPNGLDLRRALISKGYKFKNYIENDLRLQNIINRVAEENASKQENYKLVIYGLMTEFFIILMRNYINETKCLLPSETHSKIADLITPALSKIFKDYSQKITVEELADLCSVTKYHFCRSFKKETGLTVVQYIINYRISVAEVMLKTTDNNIEDIAYACGFDDVSYFYRCYKKVKGTSPKKSRK